MAIANRRGDIGKAFEIFLPLDGRAGRVSYRFRFVVSGLVAERITWA